MRSGQEVLSSKTKVKVKPKPKQESFRKASDVRSITVDVGTGDGLFVYKCAQSDPQKFFIGIDANRRPLEKISEKIHRRPAKGGLPNVLFAQAAAEDLPDELSGIASEALVQFPWVRLLRGVVSGDEVAMRNLRQICAPEARLQVMIGLDPERDRHEWERLELPRISADYLNTVLDLRYRNAGFRIVAVEEFASSQGLEFQTSWARRLQTGSGRSFIRLTAEAA